MAGWIGVDLDGTLAEFDGFKGIDHIGKPIRDMVHRVNRWLNEGRDIRLFTARVSAPLDEYVLFLIAWEVWSMSQFGRVLPVTNQKDFECDEIYDDRAVQVEKNSGRIIGYSTRGLHYR